MSHLWIRKSGSSPCPAVFRRRARWEAPRKATSHDCDEPAAAAFRRDLRLGHVAGRIEAVEAAMGGLLRHPQALGDLVPRVTQLSAVPYARLSRLLHLVLDHGERAEGEDRIMCDPQRVRGF